MNNSLSQTWDPNCLIMTIPVLKFLQATDGSLVAIGAADISGEQILAQLNGAVARLLRRAHDLLMLLVRLDPSLTVGLLPRVASLNFRLDRFARCTESSGEK